MYWASWMPTHPLQPASSAYWNIYSSSFWWQVSYISALFEGDISTMEHMFHTLRTRCSAAATSLSVPLDLLSTGVPQGDLAAGGIALIAVVVYMKSRTCGNRFLKSTNHGLLNKITIKLVIYYESVTSLFRLGDLFKADMVYDTNNHYRANETNLTIKYQYIYRKLYIWWHNEDTYR